MLCTFCTVQQVSMCCAAGAAVVKYGSLLLSAPIKPDATLAVALVSGPCLIFSIILLARK